jgi:hypothetical protein
MAPPLSARTGRLRMFDGSRPFESGAEAIAVRALALWRKERLANQSHSSRISQAVGLGDFFVRRCCQAERCSKAAGVRRRPRRWRVSDRLANFAERLEVRRSGRSWGDGQICTGVSVSFSLVIIGDN